MNINNENKQNKNKEIFNNIILKLARRNWIHINDIEFLKRLYRQRLNKELNIENPKTFNEKIQWLKIHDRNPEYVKMVDKYKAKEYVGDIIGKEYIIPTLGIYEKFNEINFDILPNEFVMKCTHNSGGIIICKNKNELNLKDAKRKLTKNLKKNYYYGNREWPYKQIKPRIIIEEYMEDKKYKELVDYKVMCFNGEPKMNFTCTERFNNGLKVTFFDMNWNKLPFERHYPISNKAIEKPKNYEKMIELSKLLSKNIPFVRVDWYEINGKLYFGELTFYPGSGMEEFTPDEWDLKVGNMLDISNIKIYK